MVAPSAVAAFPAQLFSGEFLEWALAFFVLAVLAWAVGARGIAGISMEIARLLVLVFLVLALLTLVL
ncbi:DUF1328 family protein [Halosegnis marinus]|uniref:UPF0391 membrane protein ACFQJ4_11005 n=1 Tax=Halosegnis marinus TaxID=3034023 RepID=A0ABD5ZR69_9EURY|nr:DUF1328 family protein [Halosegnis sp. DT85]